MQEARTHRIGENTHQVAVPLRARVGALMRKAKSAVEDKVSGTTWLDAVVVLAKYGVGSVVAIYLVYMMTGTMSADLKAVQKEAQGIRAEHVQMGMYMQAICYGTNSEAERWRCRAADAHKVPE